MLMGIERLGLSETDIDVLAQALDQDPGSVENELEHRPWSLLDVLEDPAVVAAVLKPNNPLHAPTSTYLFFAVITQQASIELRSSTVVNEWNGPGSRLPVFDVAPLREFIEAPGRVLFTARLLATFSEPSKLPVPVGALDLEGLTDWLDVVVPADRPTLYRHLGDLALFRSGVLADKTGQTALGAISAERLGRSLDLTSDEILGLIAPDSFSPGIDAMEALGRSWYRAATETDNEGQLSMVINDIANRFRPARRFLNHLADHYLNQTNPTIGLSA
jgi:hypothetical protein